MAYCSRLWISVSVQRALRSIPLRSRCVHDLSLSQNEIGTFGLTIIIRRWQFICVFCNLERRIKDVMRRLRLALLFSLVHCASGNSHCTAELLRADTSGNYFRLVEVPCPRYCNIMVGYIYIYKLNVKTEATILSLGFRVRDGTPVTQNQM